MFGKFFSSTFTGSMMGAGAHVFATWAYVVANAIDSQVELNPRLLATIIGCTIEDIEKAIAFLTAPDAQSRSKEHEGRRLIKEGAFAYHVVNHANYRNIRDEGERRSYMRNYMKQYRINSVNSVNSVSSSKPIQKQKQKQKKEVHVHPSLGEVKLVCQKSGLPDSDADWFFNKCVGNGWTNGGRPIKSWPHTIAAWKAAGYMPSQKTHTQKRQENVI